MICSVTPSLDELYLLVRKAEQICKLFKPKTFVKKVKDQPKKGDGAKSVQDLPRKKRCWRCGRVGHAKFACTTDLSMVKCFLCSKMGHIKFSCPQNPKSRVMLAADPQELNQESNQNSSVSDDVNTNKPNVQL